MLIVKSDFVSYGYTVKDNRVGMIDYERWFTHVDELLPLSISCKYGELDSQGKLHFHGVIRIPKKFYRRKLMLKGYHLKLEELYNEEGWLRYCQKDQKDKLHEERLDYNQYLF